MTDRFGVWVTESYPTVREYWHQNGDSGGEPQLHDTWDAARDMANSRNEVGMPNLYFAAMPYDGGVGVVRLNKLNHQFERLRDKYEAAVAAHDKKVRDEADAYKRAADAADKANGRPIDG